MRYSDTFYIFDREEWQKLNTGKQIQITDEELNSLRALNDRVSLEDVREVYLPALHILDTYIHHYDNRQKEKKELLNLPQQTNPYIIGIAGSVAVGKSTTARLFQTLLSRAYKNKRVELLTTDGFLYPNNVLKRENLLQRKGFPESYDMARLIDFMADVKSGKKNVRVPVYSHELYDIVPDTYAVIEQPDILIVEGINVLQLPSNEKIYVSDFFDFSVYLDAEPHRIEKWYLERFGLLLNTAFQNPDNYYAAYAGKAKQEAFKMAQTVWENINLKNLQENIMPTRFRADMILHKTTDHFIDQVLLRKY